MGIELEFVDQSEPAASVSVHSDSPSSGAKTLNSGTFPVSDRFNGRRRRNSDSMALPATDVPAQQVLRRRSISITGAERPRGALLDTAPAGRHIDPWLAQLPHPDEVDKNTADLKPSTGPRGAVSLLYRPAVSRTSAHDKVIDTFQSVDISDLVPVSNDKVRSSDSAQAWQDFERPARPPSMRRDDQYEPPSRDPSISSSVLAVLRRSTLQRNAHDTSEAQRELRRRLYDEANLESYPDVGTSVAPSVLSDDADRIHSPRSVGVWGIVRGESEMTVHDDMEEPPPKHDPVIMAKIADAYFAQCSLITASRGLRMAAVHAMDQRAYANTIDKEMATSEALILWSSKAGTRLHNDDGIPNEYSYATAIKDDTVPEGGLLKAARDKKMRMAARAYQIHILHKAFTHWHVVAQEESERTGIARRHLLRKKFFRAWCQQNVSDENKISSFVARGLVNKWKAAAAIKQSAERSVVGGYERELSKEAASQWTLGVRLKMKSIRSVGQTEDRKVTINALTTWKAESVRRIHLEYMSQHAAYQETCGNVLRDWHKQARLEIGLRQTKQHSAVGQITQVLATWNQDARQLEVLSRQLDVRRLLEWIYHWRNEAKLSQQQEYLNQDLKFRTAYQWMLEERAAVLHRYHLRRRKQEAAKNLLTALRRAQARQAELGEKANLFDKHHALSTFASVARAQLQGHSSQLDGAIMMSSKDLATNALTCLALGTFEHEEMADFARRGAYYVATANAISGWAKFAKKTREERLRETYHQFRREVKRNIASLCVSDWLSARDASISAGWEADAVRAETARQEVVDTLNTWIGDTNDKLVKQSIATEGDMEAQLSRWRLHLEDYLEDYADATEHYHFSKLGRCWDSWELQFVQLRGRHHTALELGDKNNKRMSRQVLGAWRDSAVPIVQGPEDLISSAFSRHTGRRSWRPGYSASSTPLGPVLAFDDDQAALLRAAPSSPLQPILEFEEKGSDFKRPRLFQQLSDHLAPSTEPVPQRHTHSRSAPPLSFGERVALPQRFKSAYQTPSSTLLGTQIDSSVASSPPKLFSELRRDVPDTQAPAPQLRFSSLHRKLQQAARLAASVQVRPASDDSADDAESHGMPAAYSGRIPRPVGVQDTPSRSTGLLPAPMTGRADGGQLSSTTPLAPLPSPRERQLRFEYTNRGILRESGVAAGRGSAVRGGRVTFAGTGDGEGSSDTMR
jgi:hypothetical protein